MRIFVFALATGFLALTFGGDRAVQRVLAVTVVTLVLAFRGL